MNKKYVAVGYLLIATASISVVGCDGSESRPDCPLLEDETYTSSAVFTDINVQTVARFEFQQTVKKYDDSGDCDRPSADMNDFRVIVSNLTSCTLDINYSLSVFKGQVGWTVTGTSHVRARAAEDLGVVHRGGDVRADDVQVILTGSVVRSECT